MKRSLALTVIAGSMLAAGFGQQAPQREFAPFQVSYFPNLNRGDSVINMVNTGARGADLPYGTSAAITGAICVNVYVLTPDEQLFSCCSCPITPNGLRSISAREFAMPIGLTPSVPTSVVVKLVATVPVNANCSNSAATLSLDVLAPGLAAWGTKIHNIAGTDGITETPFIGATLSAGELNRLSAICNFILANGSGFGVCRSCRLGGLGGEGR
jgi:hypothetical protein